jgi:cyclopropane fatty-acyl-phospholipid synthase-like methyltransferase
MPMKSNLELWKTLQERDYFETHPCYRRADGTLSTDADDDTVIEGFLELREKKRVAVLGCGFGRDVAVIAPKVGHVWGVDVSEVILAKALKHLAARGLTNFTPVLAERWREELPNGLDFVYSVIVFQHLTRDLVRDYVLNMPHKLAPEGEMLCQFADMHYGTHDAGLEHAHEPSVRWNRQDIEELVAEAGMKLYRIKRQQIEDHGDWWWAHFGMR